jgi:signal transduction histidine kinase
LTEGGGQPNIGAETGPEGIGPEGIGPEGIGPEGFGPEGFGVETGPEGIGQEDIGLTIRRIAGGARLIGLGWMLVLVLVALARQGLERPAVGWLLAGGSLTWGVLSGLDHLRKRGADPTWVTVGDAVLAALALLAPEAAGSDDLFYGGFPGIAVAAAAARSRRWGWLVALALSAVTVARFQISDVGAALARLSALVTYLMLAAIVGWAVHVIYRTDRARRQAEESQARAEERSRMAAHLHDSVLQTLSLIQRQPDDPRRVISLARRQERELRDWLYGTVPADGAGLALAVRALGAAIEDEHRVKVEVVTAGDAPIDSVANAVLGASREAVVNAAKHAGTQQVAVYLEIEEKIIRLFVRDRGVGFDLNLIPPDRAGLRDSIKRRIESIGGRVEVRSSPGKGTEIRIEVNR